jgi:hypothetical protein
MPRVRFAPSPTGPLNVGNALAAVANRRFGEWMPLRIDDTDAARNVPGGEEAILRDLEELGLPRHDVHHDPARIRRLAVEALAAMPDEELAALADAPIELVPALRGARDLNEARDYARLILAPEPGQVPGTARPTLERFRELEPANGDGRAVVRELKAVGGDLTALRLALTGRDRGPELATVIDALPLDEALRRIDAAL